MNVKKILIIIVVIVLIGSAVFISNLITQNRANKIYTELENRYRYLEKSNNDLREINTGLKENNIKLGKELENSNGFIVRTREITTELESEIAGARTTIERIEITVGFIEKIIRQLPEKIIVLEENNAN